jgi:hypothetical protein
MPNPLPAGPYRHIPSSDGADVPYYIVPFDQKGRCIGPQTRQHLLDRANQYTDIYLFSHGWNNDWKAATANYESFIEGFIKMRADNKLPMHVGYKPLLVGIFWPSAILVHEDEQAPKIAADAAAMDADAAAAQQMLADLASELSDKDVERFYELAQKDGFTEAEALEFAKILQPVYRSENDELSGSASRNFEEIVTSWKELTPAQETAPPSLDSFGTTGATTGANEAAVPAGGFLDFIKDLPRNALRGATVWQMKDRAGTVGAKGVSPLLIDLLQKTNARIHLIGHSYGAKVVLSALCSPDRLPDGRKVHSVLLLQPAVSHLCFAASLPMTGKPGGYLQALDRGEQPILSTFSSHDFPLTKVFHLALVRPSDLGEIKIAAETGEPPSVFAALGGFGPRHAGEKLIDIQDVKQPYRLDPAVRIYGLRADRTISSHGDVSNPSTWWALYNVTKV